MKWLKLFEGFSDPLYRELTEEEWSEFDQELDRYKPFVNFPEKLFLKLRGRSNGERSRWFLTWMKEHRNRLRHGYEFSSKWTGVLWINGLKINGCFNYVTVWMLDDEWFMIRWEMEDETTYYKCDQFEGLVELLKNKGVIK